MGNLYTDSLFSDRTRYPLRALIFLGWSRPGANLIQPMENST